jgi:hypothetical protein
MEENKFYYQKKKQNKYLKKIKYFIEDKKLRLMNRNQSLNGGIGLGTVLFCLFLFLKLGQFGEVANWSWWWVTSPLWLPIALILPVVLIVMVIVLIVVIFKPKR